jgi:hypothetical protein
VGADVTKNITLVSGYKVSGYIKDTNGAPMAKAVVSLDNFFCGWYSKTSGRYFVTVPAGTYMLCAKPANGPQGVSIFPTYYEYDVTVNGDLTKDIIVQAAQGTKISGYVLDEEGNGLADAHIIFNVPDIVPSVVTDASGHYTISAPPGTYHVNVWPSFDSNYVNYDESAFTVGTSDISKNITLITGYKLSGYLKDSSGAPIRGAAVLLSQFGSGWFSDDSGYFFVVAPAGTYNLTITPRRGPTFMDYIENNFVLDGDRVKNVTLTLSATNSVNDEPDNDPEDSGLDPSTDENTTVTTPTTLESIPVPTLNQSLTLCSDDFSSDSGFWQYSGSAYRDKTNEYLVLTESVYLTGGVAWFKAPIQGSFIASFRYKTFGGSKGDGFTMFFFKQNYSTVGTGGSLGFTTVDDKIVPGYGIEFDGWKNWVVDFQHFEGGEINPPGADPSSSHIALIEGYVGNHLAYVDDNRIGDNQWHQVIVEVQASSVRVFVDQELVLLWEGPLNRTFDGFGFSGADGGVGTNWHIIDDFSISGENLEKPSLSVLCQSSSSYSGFNVEIEGSLTLNETAVPDAPILLSCSVNGGKSWEDLTLVYTDADGSYSATWLPSATGNYLVKATYEGDANGLGTSETVNFAVSDFTDEKTLFSVSSNSTVTSLEFNNTTSGISFNVTGPSGTKGYVKCTIAKSLVPNVENIKLFLDGNQLNYDITSNADSWIIYVTYAHSSHQISINLQANADESLPQNKEYWTWTVATISIALIGVSPLVYFKKHKNSEEHQK